MNRTSLGILAALTALTLTACSSDEGADDDTTADTDTSASESAADADSPAPEAETPLPTTTGEAETADPDGAVDLPDGNAVSVNGFSVGGDSGGPWLVVESTITNPSDVEGAIPSFTLICADSPVGGDIAGGSNVNIGDPLPPGETVEATLNLLIPGDTRAGGETPPCTGPAYVEASAVTSADAGGATAHFPVPDDVVAQLG